MISESALHAYADGEIDEGMHHEVETWLASNPEDLDKVAEWRQQGHDLRVLFSLPLNEEVPASLLKAAQRFPSSNWLKPALLGLGAVFFLLVGGVGGYLLATL